MHPTANMVFFLHPYPSPFPSFILDEKSLAESF